MGEQKQISYVLGSKKFAGASNKPQQVPLNLESKYRTYVQGDRTTLIDLPQIFDFERQNSTTFRISGKIVNIFNNSISGKTSYIPFKNNLYYLGADSSVSTGVWKGYPQYDEFSFIRNTSVNSHVDFVSKSATTYNWGIYASYCFSSTTAQTMSYNSEKFNVSNNGFNVSDGIPFVLDTGTINGKPLVFFYCATDHNLKVNDYVKLNITINGEDTFNVYSIGDGEYRSERRVFAIYDLKFNAADIVTGRVGNFKRITDISNSAETLSNYYVRLHKIIKTPQDIFLVNSGFENNPFPIKKKLEYSGLTPNNVQRISVKDGNQTYGFSVNSDINIENLIDNNGKPVTDLFISIVNRGYMGWFNFPGNNDTRAIDVGWEFNFSKNSYDPWWNHNSSDNKDNIYTDSYTKLNQTFYYNNLLQVGDVIKGDFCEYNKIEQKEYVLSPIYHKYSFNPIIFIDDQMTNAPVYPTGYVYKPHYNVPIRTFSDYVESAIPSEIANVPYYAYYSQNSEKFIWRDIYEYGFIDNDRNGLNIPFVNGAHYPYKEIIFLQHPIFRNTEFISTGLINEPENDECE
jgi:hypothetical protein